jgi:hypothetical protein
VQPGFPSRELKCPHRARIGVVHVVPVVHAVHLGPEQGSDVPYSLPRSGVVHVVPVVQAVH